SGRGPGRGRSDGAYQVGGVGVEGGVLGVVHEVQAEVVGADLAQFRQPVHVQLRRPEQAEPVHDVVGHEVGGRVVRLPVVGVVVAFARLDVVGERPGHRVPRVAVAGHQVGDVVADHAAEPAGLVPHVRVVLADVGGCGDADRHRPGV